MRIYESTDSFSGVIPDIRYINSRFIKPREAGFHDQLQSVKWWLRENPGETKEDWARYWLSNHKTPIPVDWAVYDGWDMSISDGHHRLLAYMWLGLMPRVKITADQIPVSWIATLKKEGGVSLKRGGPDLE
jgi:hypothetical protein